MGSSSIAWVMPFIWAGGERNGLGTSSWASGIGLGLFRSPITNGTVLIGGNGVGPPADGVAVPWMRMEVPWGIVPIRTTVGGSAGSVVCGTVAQMPGSMCRPAPVLESEICCR